MKTFKKITAVAVALAMVLSLMTIGVFAAGAITVDIEASAATVGQGKEVTVNIYYSASEDVNVGTHGFQLNYTAPSAITVTDVTPAGALYTNNEDEGIEDAPTLGDGYVKFGSQTKVKVTTNKTLVAALKIAVPADATVGNITFEVEGPAYAMPNATDVENSFNLPTIAIVEAAEITAVADAPAVTKPMLTAKADIIAALPTEVEITAPAKVAGKKVAVSAWECVDYNDKTTAAQTFVGTLAPVDPITAAAGLTAKATVTLTQLTEATLVAADYAALTIKKGEEGTEKALKALVLENYKEVALNDGVDKITLTDAMLTVADATEGDDTTVLDTAEAGKKTTVTIEIPAETESDGKIFKLAAAKKVAEVEISVKASSGGYTPSGIGKPIGGGNANFGGGVTEDKTEDEKTEEEGKTEEEKTEDEKTEDEKTEDEKTEDGETTEDGKTEEGEVAGVEFADVAADYWAADYITTLKDMGIINGKAEGKFEPEAQLTRAEFAKMIAVAMNLTATATESTFADCGADDWYTPFVIAVNEAGFVNGKGDAFDANGSISREEICTILGRIVGATEGAELAFADAADVADWAADGVAAMVSLGVVNGYEDNTFKGAANATRAEVSKMLVAFLTATAETPAE